MLNKNISIWRGTQTPPTNYHLWEKEDGGLYIYLDEKWQQLVSPTDKITLDKHQKLLDKIKNLTLTEINPIDNNTYKSYLLKSDDNIFGTTINIPKDRFIKLVTLGYDNATIDESTGIITIGTGLSKEYLLFSVALLSGSYELVSINLTNFLTERNYADGLEVIDNKIKVKIDPDSEEYLKVTNNGIKVEGINTKVSDTVEDIKTKILNGEWLSLRAGRDTDNNIKLGAIAEGTGTTASSENSHAEGHFTTASGKNSHASGNSTNALGENSHAEGSNTHAKGVLSHTEGLSTKAIGNCSHALGALNYDDSSFIDMVGIGGNTSNSVIEKNAAVIYVGRDTTGEIDVNAAKNGYQYLIDVGGYQGQEIGDAKSVQEVFADINNVLYTLHARVTLTASPTIIEKGVSTAINLSWLYIYNDKVIIPTSMELKSNNNVLENIKHTYTDTINNTKTYLVTAINEGVTNTSNIITVNAYYPMYFGEGSNIFNQIEVITIDNKRPIASSPRGDVSIAFTGGKYLWLCIPSTMNITKVTSNGFTVPMEAPITLTIHESYKCYRSTDTINKGIVNFTILDDFIIKDNTIKTSEIDFTTDTLQKFNNSISSGDHVIKTQYSVVDTTHDNIVGQMLLIGDSLGHMVTEILTTSAELKDGVIDWNAHSDTEVNTYIRRNHVKEGGTSSIDVGSWSKWTYYSGEGQYNDFKILVAEELSKKVNTSDVVQQTGDSTTSVMSQKTVTDAILVEIDRATTAENAILYDVSAHNDGAVFESISSLLSASNLSTLIPTSVRHGGMSIRFVKSSDNKYVQFRYVREYENTTAGNAAFMNTENWEDWKTLYSNTVIAETVDSGFQVTDEGGNIGLRYNENGLDATRVSSHFIQVLKDAGIGGGNFVGISQISQQAFAVTDENGWIGMMYTNQGLDAAKLSSHLKTLINAYQLEDGEKLEFGKELNTYFDKGASNQGCYNNANAEPWAFITAGQSNADGRIPLADFPQSCDVAGTTIPLSTQIAHCKFMKGSTSTIYDEPTMNFTSRTVGNSWAFDDVLYNLINNYLGGASDFYVCKQTLGATSLKYRYSTSFCPDLEKFNNNPTWTSQLYHLYLQIKRARELQPNIRFKAMFWHQGEADHDNAEDGIYYNDFIHLIAWCRGLCNNPTMPFIFGTIPKNSNEYGVHVYNDMVKAAQTVENVFMVEMPNCNDWVQDGMNVHFGATDATYLATEMYKILITNKII